MLLSALYDFSKTARGRHGLTLFESPQFESRYVSWLIDLDSSGNFQGWVLLADGDQPGMLFDKLPRTLEPKDSGTVAEFLVEDVGAVLRLGESPGKPQKDKTRQKHQNFWSRVESAANELKHTGLQAVLQWKANCVDGGQLCDLTFGTYQKPGSRAAPKEQWLVRTGSGVNLPLYFRANTSVDVTFKVGGQILVYDNAILGWWSDWVEHWIREREVACRAARGGGRVCVVSQDTDAPISNSHLPKIRGRVIQSFGATLASAEADSYQSYGLGKQEAAISGTRKGPDASYANVSVRAAIAYCTALNYLLEHEDHHIDLGPLSVCFWAKAVPQAARQFNLLMSKAHPDQVQEFLRGPFAGVEREVLKRDRLYTVALSGNAGRVVVQHWIDQTLDEAVRHFAQWWADLEIVPVVALTAEMKQKKAKANQPTEPSAWPLAIGNLARVSLRRSKEQKDDKLVSERVVQLYRAALEGTAPPVTLLKPILDEFQSALVKNDDSDAKKRTYPFSSSRFVLIKLILARLERSRREARSRNDTPSRKEIGFMPTYELAETADPAYNLGRLLAVFEALQDKYHEYEKKSAGVVERYYGTASSAPAAAFPLLCRLARHHVSKVRRDDENAAAAIDRRMGDILVKFQSPGPGQPPRFPRVLSLEEQGRFALGFYQQRAFNSAAVRVHGLLKKARETKDNAAEQDALVAQARELAEQFRTPELIEAVNRFDPNEKTKD